MDELGQKIDNFVDMVDTHKFWIGCAVGFFGAVFLYTVF